MDMTYWGHNFGVVIFKDCRTKRVLWSKFVCYEMFADYQEGISWFEDHHFKIDGIVCDELCGVFKQLSRYRVQICQYHQLQIVRHYLILSPELPASIKLLSIANLLSNTDKEIFIDFFEA